MSTNDRRTQLVALRFKAKTGELASAATRDLVARVPKQMQQHVEGAIEDGSLVVRWSKALQDAQKALPDAELGELTVAAVTDLLAWSQRLATEAVVEYLGEIESQRSRLVEQADKLEAELRAGQGE